MANQNQQREGGNVERGWIRLWRKLQDSAVWQDPHLLRLFEWCLFSANYREGWVKVEGVIDPVKVGRGQFITGRHSLNRKLYPRQREKDPSPSTTWRWLLSLKKGKYLHLQMNKRFTIVTVCNYDTYNPPESESGQPNEPPMDSRRTAGGQPVDTEKKEKKDKKTDLPNGKSSPEQKVPKPPSQYSFPLVGGKLWDLPPRKLDEYLATHAEKFDVHYELRKARTWLMTNDDRRPRSGRGLAGFLTRWLNRASDSTRRTMLGSRVAAKPDDDAVFNPETGEIVKPLE